MNIFLNTCFGNSFMLISVSFHHFTATFVSQTFDYPQLSEPGGTNKRCSAVISNKSCIICIQHIESHLDVTHCYFGLLNLFVFLLCDFFSCGFLFYENLFVNRKRAVPKSRHQCGNKCFLYPVPIRLVISYLRINTGSHYTVNNLKVTRFGWNT